MNFVNFRPIWDGETLLGLLAAAAPAAAFAAGAASRLIRISAN